MQTPHPPTSPHDGFKPVDTVRETTLFGKCVRLALAAGLVLAISATLFFLFRVDTLSRVDEMASHLESQDSKLQKLAAYELWKIGEETSPEQRLKAGIDDHRVGLKLLVAYRSSSPKETDTNRFLVLALGYFRCQDAVGDLARDVQRSRETPHELRVDALFSLGLLRNPDAVPCLIAASKDPNPEVRKEAAIALGRIGDKAAIACLEALLPDSEAQVEWSAALALAALGSPAGKKSFGDMLDRQALETRTDMDEQTRAGIMIQAIRAIQSLDLEEFLPTLGKAGKSDPNLQVRSEALRALQTLRRNGAKQN